MGRPPRLDFFLGPISLLYLSFLLLLNVYTFPSICFYTVFQNLSNCNSQIMGWTQKIENVLLSAGPDGFHGHGPRVRCGSGGRQVANTYP